MEGVRILHPVIRQSRVEKVIHTAFTKEETNVAQCPACATQRVHTEAFEKILSVIANELKERKVSGTEDTDELAMALAVLVSDALKIDIYQ